MRSAFCKWCPENAISNFNVEYSHNSLAERSAISLLVQKAPPAPPLTRQLRCLMTVPRPTLISPPSAKVSSSRGNFFVEPLSDARLSADARKLMSHEHRALGFRPPPGSVAAEAQALVAKTTEVKVETETAKPRRMSSSSDSKWRRGSNESSPTHSRRESADLSSKPKVRRGSNEPTTIKRSSSDEGVKTAPKSAATRRKSVNVSGLSAAEKEVLLREVALRDAERIKYVK